MATVWAQDSIALSLAGSIGSSLAKGAVGAIGSFAFGQMMSAFGFDMSGQAAMNAKLDEILGKLNALQTSVDRMQNFLATELTQMQYDAAYASVAPLIARNQTLNDKYSYLLKTSPSNAFATKVEIGLLLVDPDYQAGLHTWHNAMVGANGHTSLIAALSRAVFNKQPIFNQQQASLIQQYWDYFDAHQALTVSYLMDHLNNTKRHDDALNLLSTWYDNRTAQLALVRGGTRAVDVFPKASGKTVVTQQTPMNALPKSSLYSKSTGYVWFTNPLGPLPGRLFAWDQLQNLVHNVNGLVQPLAPSPAAWSMVGDDTMKNLAADCGVSQKGMQAFIDAGFELDNARTRVLSTCTYVHADPIDVADCSSYGTNDDDKMYAFVARPLAPGEKFFYA